jgi:UDP-N-acetylmuramate--alanine ligase
MTAPAKLPRLFGRSLRALHCVGVGGMGLGPLAIHLAGRGFRVSGGDDAMTPTMRAHLERAGVQLGGAAELPADTELVVASSAIPPDHPVLEAAARRGLLVARRGEVLAEVARDRRLVAVCGSHGKTTTTAMLITALRAARVPIGYVGGGLFADDAITPAAAGENEWLVAEIDESDGTIGGFSPELTVVVNLDWDHPDFYRRPDALEHAFAELFKRTRGGVLVSAACATSLRLAQMHGARREACPVASVGARGDYVFTVKAGSGLTQELALSGRFPCAEAQVRAWGEFNATNAALALAAAHLMGAPVQAQALARYPGVRRRQAVLRAAPGPVVIEDYAHHPAEIAALLTGLRAQLAPAARLLAVFQPHRYSRTAQFRAEFAGSLGAADAIYLLDVYGAGEKPLPGGTTVDLAGEFEQGVTHHPGAAGVALTLRDLRLRLGNHGDTVAFIGAGDIDVIARQFVAELAAGGAQVDWAAAAVALSAAVSPQTKVMRDKPLARLTTLGVGGAARLYAEPASAEDLGALLRGARQRGVPVLPLGRGSNLLVPDEGVDALVIALHHEAWATFAALPDGRMRVGAGLRLKNLCGLAVKAGRPGFEFLEGIPGNVGGALCMNAGAMGGWMFDVVESVELMTLEGERRTLSKAAMHVDYRHCAELAQAFALGAVLRPAAAAEVPSDDIARQIDTYRDKRKKSQPREPSAGCIFKNPPGDAAGRLIDAAGLKGHRIGGAEVSPVHANFIVNMGGATSADVIALVRHVRATVEAKHGVRLDPEVLLFGRVWKEFL